MRSLLPISFAGRVRPGDARPAAGGTTAALLGAPAAALLGMLLGPTLPASAFDDPQGPTFVGFAAPIDLGINGPPIDVAVGDVDGDGRVDIAAGAASSFGGLVTIWIAQSNGTFVPQSAQLGLPGGATTFRLADLDGDGIVDFAVSDGSGDSLRVQWGLGTGGFEVVPTIVPLGGGPQVMTIADVDGDGLADVLTGNDTGTVTLVRSLGGRDFASASSASVGGVPTSIAAADLDGDGDIDVVVGIPGSNSVRLVRSTGTSLVSGPTLSAPGVVSVSAGQALGSAAFADIAAVDDDGKVRLWESLGGLTVASPLEISTEIAATAVMIADMDNDGDGDIVVTDGGPADESQRIRVLVGRDGGFDPLAVVEDDAINAFTLVDLDGNTSLDFVGVVEDKESRLVRTRINVTDVLPPGPFDLAFPPDGTTGLPRPEDLIWEGATARLRWTAAAGFTVTYRVRIADNPLMLLPVLDAADLTGVTFDVPPGTLSSSFTWFWTVEACTAAGTTIAESGVAGFSMTCREDLDGDGEIGFGDVLEVLTSWGQLCG